MHASPLPPAKPGQLSIQLPLAVGELGRDHYLDLGVQVAAPGAAQTGHALSGQPEALPVLRLRRKLERQVGPLGSRHGDLAAKHGRVQRNLYPDDQIVALEREAGMRPNRDDQEEIAWWPTASANATLTRDADPRAVGYARRDLDLDRLQLAARILDLDRAGGASKGLLERDLDRMLVVLAGYDGA